MSETDPLLPVHSGPQPSSSRPKTPRTVTFNPTVIAQSPPSVSSMRNSHFPPLPAQPQRQGSQPMLSALNNKLRRRNSSGSPLVPTASALQIGKIGPQRTTRTVQKLKLLPDPEHGEEIADEESGRDVYAQLTRLKDPTSRRDAARLGKEDRQRLPRVTAYCTATSYRMDDLLRFLKGKAKTRETAPKLFDECIYTPYRYGKSEHDRSSTSKQRADRTPVSHAQSRRYSDSAIEVSAHNDPVTKDLVDFDDGHNSLGNGESSSTDEQRLAEHVDALDFDTTVHIPEVFLFEYGTVVIWGMTLQQEQRFLREIAKFEVEKLSKEHVQTEDFNFYYTREYQARIYNDFISLREKKNYMTKLAISHALSQSVKTSLYEDLVDTTIDTCKDIPEQIAETGKIDLTRRQINMQIGELFGLRINIHLQGSVLDAPELMWAEPQLEPVYDAVRKYLEMDQRTTILTQRLNVIGDLLAVLKDQLTNAHGELLEWIVIILIAAEIIVAAINIVVDLYAGVD